MNCVKVKGQDWKGGLLNGYQRHVGSMNRERELGFLTSSKRHRAAQICAQSVSVWSN